MPTLSVGGTNQAYRKTTTWNRSPRDSDGRLLLKSLNMNRQVWVLLNRKGPTFANTWLTNANREGDVRKGSAFMNEAYTLAYDRFRAKVWGDAQTMLAVDVMERQSTLSMISGTVMRLYRAAKHVKRGKFKEAAKALSMDRVPKGIRLRDNPSQVFAENWLAYRYGWSPFYGSIVSLMEVLDKPLENRFVRSSGKVMRELQDVYKETSGLKRTTQIDYYQQYVRVVLKASMEVSDPSRARLKQFGVLNPLEVVWELVPFSFVADWFLPIGAYLEDMTSFAGLTFTEGSITYHGSSERLSLDMRTWWPANYGSFHQYRYTYKDRVATNSFAPPGRSIFTNGLNPTRCLDAISLLRSVLMGGRK